MTTFSKWFSNFFFVGDGKNGAEQKATGNNFRLESMGDILKLIFQDSVFYADSYRVSIYTFTDLYISQKCDLQSSPSALDVVFNNSVLLNAYLGACSGS